MSHSTSVFTILGMKRFRGSVDGKAIDSARVFVMVTLDSSRNSADQLAKGVTVEEIRCAPELVRQVEHLELPLEAEITTERVSNGQKTRENVIDIKPRALVAPVKPVKQAA